MDGYRSEEEQVEAVKKWWQENGKSVIAGVVIGISAIFGWRAWDNHTKIQAEGASILYENMLLASRENRVEDTRLNADRIVADYDKTTYGTFAKMMLAKLAAEDGDLQTAEENLRAVISDSSQAEFAQVARLRLARVLLADGNPAQALKTLEASKPGQFISQYEELRGDIYSEQGEKERAQVAYEKALANTAVNEDTQSVLQMKLDELGRG